VPARFRTGVAAGVVEVSVPGAPVMEAHLENGLLELTRPPYPSLDEMRRGLSHLASTPMSVRTELFLDDAEAARWPWECVRTGSVLRRQPGRPPPAGEPAPVLTVQLSVLDEDSRGGRPAASMLFKDYSGRAFEVPQRAPLDPTGHGGILHAVAEPVDRRGHPALQLTGGALLTAESFANRLPGGPWLVILDLALSRYDHDAVEQLTAANAFCWYLVRAHPDLDVVCGPLSDDPRIGGVRELAGLLDAGRPLAEVAEALQQRLRSSGNGAPWRGFVSVSTDRPDRRYRLQGSA
jgi:hypothetical protein